MNEFVEFQITLLKANCKPEGITIIDKIEKQQKEKQKAINIFFPDLRENKMSELDNYISERELRRTLCCIVWSKSNSSK